MIYIIEGIDRLGKDTLIKNIINSEGYHEVIHKQKPEALDIYLGDLELYQKNSFKHMFQLIATSTVPLIFNRGHLGENVYSPLYRGYDGSYVFDLESQVNTDNVKLILLQSSDTSFLTDDGDSFDVSKQDAEQALFRIAFEKSNIKNKVRIDVHNGNGGFKTPEEILKEAL